MNRQRHGSGLVFRAGCLVSVTVRGRTDCRMKTRLRAGDMLSARSGCRAKALEVEGRMEQTDNKTSGGKEHAPALSQGPAAMAPVPRSVTSASVNSPRSG